MAPLSPQTFYNALLAAGASTIQAGGILANAINESGLDPEAIGDNGTSFGFVQEHGNYSYLVTGNSVADMNAQIALLKSQGAFNDASGSTIAQAAGNFAANYEKCVGCQSGGSQYQSRVNNAATVQGWINSGNWPQSAGSPSSGSSSASTTGFFPEPFPGGAFDPLNWASILGNDTIGGTLGSAESALSSIGSKLKADIWHYVRDWLIRLGLILFGAFIIYAGIQGLLKESQTTTDIVAGGAKGLKSGIPE
jgi:Phage tail lysozyme